MHQRSTRYLCDVAACIISGRVVVKGTEGELIDVLAPEPKSPHRLNLFVDF